jgi:hypothetical protein
MKKLLIIPLLFLILPLWGQMIGRGPAYTSVGPERTYLDVVNDGNTKGWYQVGDGGATYMTLDGAVITNWQDQTINNNDLLNATGVDRPTWDDVNGWIYFDGNDQFQATIAANQPLMFYAVIKQSTWINNSRFIETGTTDNWKSHTATPSTFLLNGGSNTGDNSALAVNTWGVARVLFNGASSKIQIDITAATTGTVGSDAMTYLNIGKEEANICIKELIFRNIDDSDADELLIVNYLNNKYTVY